MKLLGNFIGLWSTNPRPCFCLFHLTLSCLIQPKQPPPIQQTYESTSFDIKTNYAENIKQLF